MMGWYHGDFGWTGWIVMSLSMVAFWSLVIVAVVLLFRGTSERGQANREMPRTTRSPLDILDERFARGEIDVEEYRSRQAALTGKPVDASRSSTTTRG